MRKDNERTITGEPQPSEICNPSPAELSSLQELIDEKVLQYPDEVALRFREHVLTYNELNNSANQLARYLLDQGIQKGDIIGLAVDRTPRMVIALLAIVKSGATYLPLDPDYPQARVEFMLGDTGTTILVTEEKYQSRFGKIAKEMLLENIWKELPEYPILSPETEISLDDIVYILYTSGSTGQPKGVRITQKGLVNFLLNMQIAPGLTRYDKVLAVTTISFDISALELYLPLITGAEVILTDTETSRDARVLMDIVRREEVSMMQATPATWRMMLETDWNDRLPLKILIGGEALSKKLAERLLARCNSLWNMYGPTETTVWATFKQIKQEDEVITVGKTIANVEAYILDSRLNHVTQGNVGEIYIGGIGVGKGYLNRPELTEERFIPNPFAKDPSEMMYRTGDLGRIVNGGDIQCLGRIDHQVKIRGYRIELGEIEYALNKQKGVRDSVVLARNEQLVAYVVPDERKFGYTTDISRWMQGVKMLLPEYMVPARLIVVPAFPISPNGKVDRNTLETMGHDVENASKAYTAPRTEQERLIASMWARLLHKEKVSIHDDFFLLGGNSIVAMQIMTQLEKETGRRLPLACLFTANTVEKLSQQVDLDDRSISWDLLVPVKPNGNKPPLFIVNGLDMNVLVFNNVACNMDPEQPVYGFQPRGLNGRDEPFDTLEDMAAEYIAALLQRDFGDTYALAGYSFGGVVAFEMAKQLQALGKTVKLLAVFDTYADNTIYFEKGISRIINKVGRQFPKFLFILRSFSQYPRQILRYQSEFFARKLHECFIFLTGKKEPEDVSLENKINKKYELAYRNYHMQPSDSCAVDLFKVDTRLYYLRDPVYLGWRRYALKGLHIHEVEGDHKTFLLPPNDRAFGALLQQVIDERMQS